MWPLKVGGLALASSLSSFLNFLLLFYSLERKIGELERRQIIDSFLRILLATLITGFFISIFWQNIFLNLDEYLRLITVIGLASLVFILSCILLKVKELKVFLS
jgi:peptidoglycan biosynthesis protein MviN/MurJ (putative lipid II flippase)